MPDCKRGVWLAILTAPAVGCAAPATKSDPAADKTVPVPQGAVKRIALGGPFEPDARPGGAGASGVILPLVSPGLNTVDGQAVRHPLLAEARARQVLCPATGETARAMMIV